MFSDRSEDTGHYAYYERIRLFRIPSRNKSRLSLRYERDALHLGFFRFPRFLAILRRKTRSAAAAASSVWIRKTKSAANQIASVVKC